MVTAVRQRMTHRALVERDGNTTPDGYGDAGVPSWATHIAALPCWLYIGPGAETARQRGTVVFEGPRLLVPVGTDITERDRINGVTDRAGAPVYDGILNILSVVPAHDHLELIVERLQ